MRTLMEMIHCDENCCRLMHVAPCHSRCPSICIAATSPATVLRNNTHVFCCKSRRLLLLLILLLLLLLHLHLLLLQHLW